MSQASPPAPPARPPARPPALRLRPSDRRAPPPRRKYQLEVNRFFSAEGPQTLTWFYQVPPALRGRPGAEPMLYLSSVEVRGLGRATAGAGEEWMRRPASGRAR